MRFRGFGEMIRHYAEARPEAPALVFDSSGAPASISFSALEQRIAERAAELAAGGHRCLGLLADGTAECVIECFAAVRAGLQVVLLDGSAWEELLAEQIRMADVDLLFGDPDLKEELAPALHAGAAAEEVRPKQILFFTSGTTASSKAVVLTEESLCASAYNGGALLPLSPEDRLLCVLPLNHVFGFVCGLLWGLSCGAAVALGRGPRHYADDCAFYRPTAISAVPLLLGFFLQHDLLNPELALVLIGAGECPPALIDLARSRGARISFGYGLTETSSGVALSLGEDPYGMTVCPDDTITLAEDGEVLIEAPTCMMQGYYKDPEGTRAALPDGKVLRTGDLGEWTEEGLLRIKGRKKEILVFPDGTKIFLPEYEAGLAPLLPERDFAVIEAGGAPVLAVKGAPEEEAAIAAAIRPRMEALPRGQQIQRIIMIPTPLPRTATGKIKRWELRQKVRG